MKEIGANLIEAIKLACQSQNIHRILQGRGKVQRFEGSFINDNFLDCVGEALDLDDYWEYRRLLELCEVAAPQFVAHYVSRGTGHQDEDICEAANDFSSHGYR